MNTKLHLLLDKEGDEKFNLLIEEYEKDIMRLELQVKSLRDQVDFLTNLDHQQVINNGQVGSQEVGKLKELIRALNADVIAKEDMLIKYRQQEREKETQSFLVKRLQEEIKSLKE